MVSDLQGGLNGIIDLKVILEDDQQTLEAACGVGPGALDFTKSTLEAAIAKFDEFVKGVKTSFWSRLSSSQRALMLG